MGHFYRMVTAIRNANAEFSLWFGTILSWPIWLPLILAGSLFGWVLQKNDLIMLLLTIQTSVDSAATKMLQNHVRGKDEERDKVIVAMLRDQEKRDKTTARQMRAVLVAMNTQNDLLKFLTRGGSENVGTRAGKSRKTNRRRNSDKS